MAARTPVTVITGYLGAGKTTLLARILAESRMRLAVVMNEFGKMNVDGRVVEGKNVRMVELLGGCVCCSLAGEFGEAIAELLEKAKPEWIVIETTGAAEPAALAHDIAENMPGVRLDAIAAVVDADAMVRFPRLGHTGREQIELADIVIINKTDLVSPGDRAGVHAAVRQLNGRALVLEAEQCGIDTGILFGIERNAQAGAHKTHDIGFEYFDYTAEEKLDHGKFLQFLESLPGEIYRSKGFVVTEKGSFLMNYVAGRSGLEEFDAGRTGLVFIGKRALAHKDAICSALDGMKRI
jgi:G3E family GTPase